MEVEEVEEDPEVTALKEEIAALEKVLKEKESKVEYLQNDQDKYSKGGYARKVAEMENMRRIRSVSTRHYLFVTLSGDGTGCGVLMVFKIELCCVVLCWSSFMGLFVV